MRPMWVLEELGLDYKLVNMEFPARATYPGYLDINPLGTVPTFLDGDLTLTESTGICKYLVDRYGAGKLAIAIDEPDYGRYLDWLFRSDATLTFPQTLVLRYTRLEPEERRLPQVVEDYSIWFHARLRYLETTLKDGRNYLVGDRFTIADIAVHYALHLATRVGLDGRFKPNTRRFYQYHLERESFKKVLDKQMV